MRKYCVVILKESKHILIVKSSWCQNIKENIDILRNGNSAFVERSIFYSPNLKEDSNFELPLSTTFNANTTGCYKGFILYMDGMIFNTFNEFINLT